MQGQVEPGTSLLRLQGLRPGETAMHWGPPGNLCLCAGVGRGPSPFRTQSSVPPAPAPPRPVSGPGKLCPSAGDIGRGRSLPVDTELCTTSTHTAPSSLWPPWRHHTGRGQKRLSCPDSWLCSQLSPAEPKDDSHVLTSCVRKA